MFLVGGNASPHIVGMSTWTLTVAGTDTVLNITTKKGPKNIGCPNEMKADLRTLFQALGQSAPGNNADWYACPGKPAHKRCKQSTATHYYCDTWGCETSSWGSLASKWNTPRGKDPLQITYWDSNPYPTGPNIRLSFTGCQEQTPALSGSWGIRRYDPTGPDSGALITLSYRFEQDSPPKSIGPNVALKDQQPPTYQAAPVAPAPPISNFTKGPAMTSPTYMPGSGDRLLNLVQGAYQTLNVTNPNRTLECWLCLQSGPPYYEGVAVVGNYTNQTKAPSQCSNTPQHRLTLSEVSGTGLCIGKVPASHQPLCNFTLTLPPGNYYLTPPNGTYWACSTGLTPCVSSLVLNGSSDYCVLIELWPKITYHESEYIYQQSEGRPRIKREPMSLTVALLLGGLTVGGITAGIGTGANHGEGTKPKTSTVIRPATHSHRPQGPLRKLLFTPRSGGSG